MRKKSIQKKASFDVASEVLGKNGKHTMHRRQDRSEGEKAHHKAGAINLKDRKRAKQKPLDYLHTPMKAMPEDREKNETFLSEGAWKKKNLKGTQNWSTSRTP